MGKSTHYSLFNTPFKNRNEEWKLNVMRNQAIKTTEHFIDKAGEQTITIYALDDGVVLDQMALDFTQKRQYYALPAKINYR